MIRCGIETLVMGSIPGSSIVMLRPFKNERYHDRILPICIGTVEAAAIGKALSRDASSRPMTHSLLINSIAQLGGKIDHVLINRVQGTIFYATLFIKRTLDTVKVDARPSDAIAIALRVKAPIYVDEKVIASASFPVWVNVEKERQQAEMEEFHQFVEAVGPEDF